LSVEEVQVTTAAMKSPNAGTTRGRHRQTARNETEIPDHCLVPDHCHLDPGGTSRTGEQRDDGTERKLNAVDAFAGAQRFSHREANLFRLRRYPGAVFRPERVE
jgi:hypothetical protein